MEEEPCVRTGDDTEYADCVGGFGEIYAPILLHVNYK